jgi:serine/threonine-protein kinase HipA
MAARATIVFIWLPAARAFVPAGRLEMVEDGRVSYATFRYGARYLRRPDAVPVDPEALPLDPSPVRTQESFPLFNGIRDAAPDGWGRYLMSRAARGKPLGEFDYLVASGDHRVGALAFGPSANAPPKRIAPWKESIEGEALDFVALLDAVDRLPDAGDDFDPALEQLLAAGSSLGGARPKAALLREGRDWIAKFSLRDDPYNICRAELAAMTLAARCGLMVPSLDVVRAAGRDVYLIERFDRRRSSRGDRERIPFASGLTMLYAHEIAAYRYGYADLAEAVRKHGTHPKQDLGELFRRMVFNVLCTNDDDHLRNHAFLFDGKGWRLSPLYDVVPKPQTSTEHRLALRVGEHGRDATLANALTSAPSFGFAHQQATVAIETLRRQVAAEWEQVFRDCGVPQEDMPRLAGCFAEARDADWAGRPPRGGWTPEHARDRL